VTEELQTVSLERLLFSQGYIQALKDILQGFEESFTEESQNED
jgi:hypothetical protein